MKFRTFLASPMLFRLLAYLVKPVQRQVVVITPRGTDKIPAEMTEAERLTAELGRHWQTYRGKIRRSAYDE